MSRRTVPRIEPVTVFGVSKAHMRARIDELPANPQSSPRSFFYAVGCASDGYCAAVGYYTIKAGYHVPMAATRL
jgi:hypothetical protein